MNLRVKYKEGNLSMRALILFLAIFSLLAGGCKEAPVTENKAASAAGGGELAPDFTLKNLQGETVRLADFRGKVVFLNFWATWCPPCRAEMPSMERLHEAMAKRNFVILAVNIENDLNPVKEFLIQNPHSFPILSDAEAKVQNLYKVFRFPETFLIDKEGRILEHYIGARNWSSVEFLKYVNSLTSER
jgi:peroxiredoxin